MSAEIRSGHGGSWGVAHIIDPGGRGPLVLLRFSDKPRVPDGDLEQVFTCELTPEVAVRLAESLIKHAQAAGFSEVVNLEIGGAP